MHTPPMPPMHTTPLFLYWYYELTQSAHKDSSSTLDSFEKSMAVRPHHCGTRTN